MDLDLDLDLGLDLDFLVDSSKILIKIIGILVESLIKS